MVAIVVDVVLSASGIGIGATKLSIAFVNDDGGNSFTDVGSSHC